MAIAVATADAIVFAKEARVSRESVITLESSSLLSESLVSGNFLAAGFLPLAFAVFLVSFDIVLSVMTAPAETNAG
eukprot:62113-Ditylum_brightwellii.AAC.1